MTLTLILLVLIAILGLVIAVLIVQARYQAEHVKHLSRTIVEIRADLAQASTMAKRHKEALDEAIRKKAPLDAGTSDQRFDASVDVLQDLAARAKP